MLSLRMKNLLVMKIISPCSVLQVWFFFNSRFFFSRQVGGVWFEWGEFSPEEKSGAKTRSSFAFSSFSFLHLGGKVRFRPGMGIAALEMGFSAWVVTVPMPGDSCLTQQDSPQWTPWKPGEDNKPASGRPASFSLEERSRKWEENIHQFSSGMAKEILCHFTSSSKGKLSTTTWKVQRPFLTQPSSWECVSPDLPLCTYLIYKAVSNCENSGAMNKKGEGRCKTQTKTCAPE